MIIRMKSFVFLKNTNKNPFNELEDALEPCDHTMNALLKSTPGPLPQPRPSAVLMQPHRLAALQPSRLSITRSFMAKVIDERWDFERVSFDIDEKSRGTALYRIHAARGMTFDFPLTSNEYREEGRTGRIIGRAWDMMGGLLEGPATDEQIALTRSELPLLYEGRAAPRTLTWARANRSSRVFDHTVEALAAGRQPDLAVLSQVCYLMRNTGIDGNGTFGTRSFRALEPGHPMRRSLVAQIASAYMMRVFAVDLVNHLARLKSPTAAQISPELQRFLGIGNGSALGLIFFLHNHPKLINRWMTQREQALVAARSLKLDAHSPVLARLLSLLGKAIVFRREDRMEYENFAPSTLVADDLVKLRALAQTLHDTGTVAGEHHAYPLDVLATYAEPLVHIEAHETLLALYIDLVPEVTDALCLDDLLVDEEHTAEPEMSVGYLRQVLADEYDWALKMDLSGPGSQKYVWYKSATAEEPRRGPRDEAGNVHQLGLDLPRHVQRLDEALAALPATQSIARLLLARPDLRSIVARVQSLRGLPYHSPQMNIMGEEFIPIHIVRLLNVAIHGVDRARDYMGRNLRGVLFHGAPMPDDIRNGASQDWFYPAEPRS